MSRLSKGVINVTSSSWLKNGGRSPILAIVLPSRPKYICWMGKGNQDASLILFGVLP